jgi:hypothetical protein
VRCKLEKDLGDEKLKVSTAQLTIQRLERVIFERNSVLLRVKDLVMGLRKEVSDSQNRNEQSQKELAARNEQYQKETAILKRQIDELSACAEQRGRELKAKEREMEEKEREMREKEREMREKERAMEDKEKEFRDQEEASQRRWDQIRDAIDLANNLGDRVVSSGLNGEGEASEREQEGVGGEGVGGEGMEGEGMEGEGTEGEGMDMDVGHVDLGKALHLRFIRVSGSM